MDVQVFRGEALKKAGRHGDRKEREEALSRDRMLVPVSDRRDRLGGVGAGEKGGAAKLIFRHLKFEVP